MGSTGEASTDWNQVAGQNAYTAASQGQSMDMINASQPEYAEANQAGYDAWASENAQYEMFAGMMESMMGGSEEQETQEEYYARLWNEGGNSSTTSSFDTVSTQLGSLGDNQVFTLGYGDDAYEYDGGMWQWGDDGWEEATQYWQVADTSAEDWNWDTAMGYLSDGTSISDAVATRNSNISAYQDALSSSTSYVNSQISEEKANAALMGVDYSMSDETKATRISDYLANLWSDSDQSNLDSSIASYGSGGFTQSVFRGAGTDTGDNSGQIEQENAGGGIIKKSTLMDEENTLGAGTSILGA